MSLTTDPNDPALHQTEPSGMQRKYLVLSPDEIRKGYVKPFRPSYRHVGERPEFPLRDLTEDEQSRYAQYGYVKYEQYPEERSPLAGRFWTEKMLHSGCGAVTQMGHDIAATYARNPLFYSATFCATCRRHFDLHEFVWLDGEPMSPSKWPAEERERVAAAIQGHTSTTEARHGEG